jgi:hypothetical protein
VQFQGVSTLTLERQNLRLMIQGALQSFLVLLLPADRFFALMQFACAIQIPRAFPQQREISKNPGVRLRILHVIREVFVNPPGFLRVAAIIQQIRHKQCVLAEPLAMIEERLVFPGWV